MPHSLTLTPHLMADELFGRYRRQCVDPVERTHWHVLWLVSTGHRCPEVAVLVGYRPVRSAPPAAPSSL